jgi:hypothetical protein
VPREINKICLSAYTLAEFEGAAYVDEELVEVAVKEIGA